MTTTRFLFIVFALLNILFFAAARGWLDFSSSGSTARGSIELYPERIKILGQTPLPETEQADLQATPAPPPPVPESPPVCLAWSGLSAAQNTKLISLFSAAGIRAVARDIQSATSWRVRIPPLPTREAAEILADNMAALGVEKSTVRIEEAGSNGFSIVFGEAFRTRQSAERYLDTVKAKGVHNASLEARNASERRVEATVSIQKVDSVLEGQPFAKRHKPCSS